MNNYKNTSLWFNTMDQEPTVRNPLTSDIDADVAIIGAGYTGLWTAYYLKSLKPELNIVILEADIAGYGASGRNGGWVAGFITGLDKYVAPMPMDARRECCRVLFDNVDEIGARLQEESINADFNKGGVLYAAARYPEQERLQRKLLKQLYETGHTEEDCYWLDAQQLEDKVRLRNGLGAIFKPHCATVNPARMVRGLADAVEAMGVKIYEKTRVSAVKPRKVTTASGTVSATTVVPALEGYSSTVSGFGRYVIPVQSLIIATEPLSDSLWDEIGLNNREAFCDGSRMVSYGQKSADGRMIFGARGGYVYGGKPRSDFSLKDEDFRIREELMFDLFPMLKDVNITHGWGGSLGMPRNFAPHAIYDAESGIATAGGYGGQGVAPSHLFGRTLADLILNRDTVYTQMPWAFNHAPHKRVLRRWEPEPFRWITSKTIVKAFTWEENLYQDKPGPSLGKSVANKVSDTLSLLMR
ncbi:FAD-dependent oxidoreductase [Amphritea opalescens]|uniref:FAD-dependent oxidoreductase n=1 Tax=Amphritea opalescens TaxID=2490544 RepID=A0A430KM24_9GAMM|nr:FAD-binding oxidoreductase [Amphritea opalescens]RTE64512.1 FAD-dependent oxidoreductase [Amphritea opalescens]